MSYKTQLTNCKSELGKLKQNYLAYCRNSPGCNWEKRLEHNIAVRKLKAKISRLKSKILLQQGPIIHRDIFGQPFLPGAQVVWSDSGRYAGFPCVWYVSYCTPKQVALVADKAKVGMVGTSTSPKYLLVVDKLVAPPPTSSKAAFYSIWDDAGNTNASLHELLTEYWNNTADSVETVIRGVKVQTWIKADVKSYNIWYDDPKSEITWEEENTP